MLSVEVKEEVLEHLFPPKLQSGVVEVVKKYFTRGAALGRPLLVCFPKYGYEFLHVNVRAELPWGI